MALSEELKSMHKIARILEDTRESDPAAADRVEAWLLAKLSETKKKP